ncbi:hypothetical protein ACFXJ8_00935 [Nonomuraea sp. NPDC059194]|uniref:hypothetical protein n=1 Tax=Nonomuraea sp. NPDC059194 TaxID=3346764 RepID=UPI00367ADF3B
MTGFTVRWKGVGRRGSDAREEARFVRGVRERVVAAFTDAGRPMGSDMYGAELEKAYPAMRDGILDALQKYADELDRVGDGLKGTANTYETVERPDA